MTPKPTPPRPNGSADIAHRMVNPLHHGEPRGSVGPVSHANQCRYPLVSQLAPLAAVTTAPGCARGHVKATLTKWNMSSYEEVAELLISEMATNAVEASTDEHGHPIYVNGRMPLIVVRLVATADDVVLEVWDFMPTPPEVKNIDATEVRGRGMFLVETLSYRWAWKTAPDWPGKCVWAELRA